MCISSPVAVLVPLVGALLVLLWQDRSPIDQIPSDCELHSGFGAAKEVSVLAG